MKKIALLTIAILIALAPLNALAQTSSGIAAADYVSLAELRTQALSGWHETYTANGREVAANVAIDWMPDAEVCPVVQIEMFSIPEDDKRLTPYREYQDVWVYTGLANLYIQVMDDEVNCETNGEDYRGLQGWKQRIEYRNNLQPIEDAQDCDLTYPQFLDKINSALLPFDGLTLDDFYVSYLVVNGPEYNAKIENGELVFGAQKTRTGNYSLDGLRLFEGIPAFEVYWDDAPRTSLGYSYWSPAGYSFYLGTTRQVGIEIADVPLLSFSAMKAALEKQIASGNLRGVDEMEFGYLPFYAGKKAERRWVLLPVWRVLGGYTSDANTTKEVMPYYDERDTDGSLSVPKEYDNWYYNAQTGEQLPATPVRDGSNPLPMCQPLTWHDLPQKKN